MYYRITQECKKDNILLCQENENDAKKYKIFWIVEETHFIVYAIHNDINKNNEEENIGINNIGKEIKSENDIIISLI